MKYITLLFLFLFFVPAHAQVQDKFVIGADWGNTVFNSSVIFPEYSSREFWDNTQAFGLNMINLNYYDKVLPVESIVREFDKAHARGISVFYNNYSMIPYTGGVPVSLRRRVYQTESMEDCLRSEDYPADYDKGAAAHWSFGPSSYGVENCTRLVEGNMPGGYVVKNIVNGEFKTGDATLIAKVKLRVNKLPADQTEPFLTLEIKGDKGGVWGELNAAAVETGEWREYELTRFSASEIGSENDEHIIPLDIALRWSGAGDIHIDYIAVDDEGADNLFKGKYDESIISGVKRYMRHPAVKYFKLWDEPFASNFLPVGYMNRLVRRTLNETNDPEIMNKTALCFNNKRNIQKFLTQTEMEIQLVDRYPYYQKWQKVYTEPGYTSSIQNQMDVNYLPRLKDEIRYSQKFGVPLWVTVQAHSWHDPPSEHWLREPTADEMRLLVNLALCYGAKGIHYFSYSRPPYGAGILEADGSPRMRDTLGLPKWQPLAELNAYVASIGDQLLQLSWRNAFSFHKEKPAGTYILNAASMIPEEGNVKIDEPNETFVELGFFDSEEAGVEYFYVVNRRTAPDALRIIRIFLNKRGSGIADWRVTEMSEKKTWEIPADGSFMIGYLPGGGRLFKLEPLQ